MCIAREDTWEGGDRVRQRNVVMAINTNSGLASLPSAAAVDHAGVTLSFLALHHCFSPRLYRCPALPCINRPSTVAHIVSRPEKVTD